MNRDFFLGKALYDQNLILNGIFLFDIKSYKQKYLKLYRTETTILHYKNGQEEQYIMTTS